MTTSGAWKAASASPCVSAAAGLYQAGGFFSAGFCLADFTALAMSAGMRSSGASSGLKVMPRSLISFTI